MSKENELKQFNLVQIIFYHLLPGIPILLISIIFSNPTWGFGMPIFLSLMLAVIFGLIPTQLGILALTARKQDKKIRDIIGFKEKTSVKKTILFSVICVAFALTVFILLPSIERPLWTIFDWVPTWFRIDRFSSNTQSRSIIVLIIVLNFIFNGIVGPIMEELYFRGFLLPRMKILGKLAPFVNVVLFSLYHFFSPWENISRILALTPYVYTVWKLKNIRIGMIVHCTMNTLSAVGMLVAFLSA